MAHTNGLKMLRQVGRSGSAFETDPHASRRVFTFLEGHRCIRVLCDWCFAFWELGSFVLTPANLGSRDFGWECSLLPSLTLGKLRVEVQGLHFFLGPLPPLPLRPAAPGAYPRRELVPCGSRGRCVGPWIYSGENPICHCG